MLSFSLICFIAVGLIAFAPDVITLLYSEKYLPGVNVFRIYSVVLILRCTYFGMILNATGKTRFIFYSSLCSLGLNIILNGVFYWLVGFIGPAIATLISQTVINVVQLIFTSRVMNYRFKDILPWKELGITAIIILVLGTPFFIIRNLFTLSGIYGVMLSIALGMIWGGIYFLIMRKRLIYKWKELNREENYEL